MSSGRLATPSVLLTAVLVQNFMYGQCSRPFSSYTIADPWAIEPQATGVSAGHLDKRGYFTRVGFLVGRRSAPDGLPQTLDLTAYSTPLETSAYLDIDPVRGKTRNLNLPLLSLVDRNYNNFPFVSSGPSAEVDVIKRGRDKRCSIFMRSVSCQGGRRLGRRSLTARNTPQGHGQEFTENSLPKDSEITKLEREATVVGSVDPLSFDLNDDHSEDIGGWGAWGEYSSCSQSCGRGQQTRSRSCGNAEGGRHCEGDSSETRDCNTISCEGETQQLTAGL